ncbi:hypothetical protein NXF25_015333 [Crotalus adamanteus]|uniref:Uncharacterized protein n=1 Tax=Crotalus adamanteus TaxID=8729 RepID=A0AAW1AXY0_CROAD
MIYALKYYTRDISRPSKGPYSFIFNTFPKQNRCLNSKVQDKNKLPSLKLPEARIHGCWNCPSSNVNLDNSLKKKCTYFHFSKPIRLIPKPVPRKTSRDVLPCGRRQLAHHTAHDFIVTGLNCRVLWQRDLPLLPKMRRPKLELHVYLPSEKDGAGARSSGKRWNTDGVL